MFVSRIIAVESLDTIVEIPPRLNFPASIYVAREHTIKWFKLHRKRFADQLAVDVFGSKEETWMEAYSSDLFPYFAIFRM